MGPTLDRKRVLAQRRRELLNNRPEHYCPRCTVLMYPDDSDCLECQLPRPEGGWPDLRDSMDPWLGRVLEGRYLLTKRIGQGASASVYRAESMAISRQFAIKIIHPPKGSMGPSPEQIAARLEREVEALGRLRNPHIVRFYDVIELPLNHIGVVMDFVEGATLEGVVLAAAGMSIARAVALSRQIANGVYEAHLVGMTHRDLKPENIMIERLPAGDDFVHVLDFGIVHVEGESSMTQGFIGTPLYASPEQAMGEDVDHRSDIYSLGAILFFMIGGRPPFVGQNVMQVLRQHVEETPPRLSEIRPDIVIPDELEVLIHRMLAKTVEERPQTLAEVIHLLDRLAYSTSEGKETVADGETSLTLAKSSENDTDVEAAPRPMLEQPPASVAGTSPGGPFKEASSIVEEENSSSSDVGSTSGGGVASAHAKSEPQSLQHSSEGAPASGIFGRVRRPMTAPKTPVVDPPVVDPPISNSLAEGTRPGIPEIGEIQLPPGATMNRLSVTTDYKLAFIHANELHLWQMTPREHRVFSVRASSAVTALALGDGVALLGREAGKIEQINLKTGHFTTLFESVFSDTVIDLAMSEDGSWLFALMRSGRVYMSSAHKASNDWVRVRGGPPGERLALSPRSDLIAVARQGGQIEISRVAEPKSVRLNIQAPFSVNAMAFTDDGYLLGVSNGKDTVSLYQVINGKHMIDIPVENHRPLGFFFSKENSLMGFLVESNTLFVADLQGLLATSN